MTGACCPKQNPSRVLSRLWRKLVMSEAKRVVSSAHGQRRNILLNADCRKQEKHTLHREGLLHAKTAWGFKTMEGRNEGALNTICVINTTHLPAHRHQGKGERKDLFYDSFSSSMAQFANRLKLDSVSLLRVLGCSFRVLPVLHPSSHLACPGLSYTSGV